MASEQNARAVTSERSARKGSVWADFYIEFLGSLVPGLFALILSLIVLGLSLFVLCRARQQGVALATFPPITDFGLGAYGVTGLLLVLSYILGSIFYRQDPKIPDWKSARRVYNYVGKDERERLAVQPSSPDSKTIQTNDAQFPYFFLYEYLKGRGLDHLAEWVPWQGKNLKSHKYRTKMFIHYLRVREIVYVLETAHFATLSGVDLHREDFDGRRRETSAGQPAAETC